MDGADDVRYSIHPSLGVARLGNSDEFYLAPTTIGGRPIEWNDKTNDEKYVAGKLQYVSNFKDAKGQIKKQGARFKIYRYDSKNPQGIEVNIENEFDKVIWKVHLANKKGTWYEFSEYDGDLLFENHSYDHLHSAFRNQSVMDDERKNLIIDPGSKNLDSSDNKIGRCQVFQVKPNKVTEFYLNATKSNKPREFWYPSKNPKFGKPLENLGKIILDSKNNLIVLGGSGHSGGDLFFSGFAGGDTWYDDISDGPVTCEIHFKDKKRNPEVLEAWVVVGSPKFAPELVNISTLEDAIFDIYVRHMGLNTNLYDRSKFMENPPPAKDPEEECWNKNFRVNFKRDIEPIMKRIASYRWVANVPSMMAFYTPSFDARDNSNVTLEYRKKFFSYFRNPGFLEKNFQGDREQLSSGNSRVQIFDKDDNFLGKFGKFGTEGQLREPTGIAVDKDGFVYITDNGYYCIKKFDKDGKYIATFGSYGEGPTQVKYPLCITVDDDFLYISDYSKNSIKIWNKNDGSFKSEFGKYGKGDTEFIYPIGVTVDKNFIYVSDKGNGCVKKFSKDDGHKFISKIDSKSPQGITIDKDGNLFICDKTEKCIKKYSSDGKFIMNIGKMDEKTKDKTNLDYDVTPYGVSVDDSGNIHVTDITNPSVKIFGADGKQKNVIGSFGLGDGQYKNPVDIAVNKNDIYVVEQDKTHGIPLMPLNAGSNSFTNDIIDKFATLTKTQYFLLGQWAKGLFDDENTDLPDYLGISKHDRADIGNCSGIPMLPGIEVTWSIKNPIIFDKESLKESPVSYRIKHRSTKPDPEDYRKEDDDKYYEKDLSYFHGESFKDIDEYYQKYGLDPFRDETRGGGCEPGDLTKRMSPPWQADFFECNIEYVSFAPDKNVNNNGIPPPPSYYSYWWPPQSPWNVISGIESSEEQDAAGIPAGLSVIYTRGINSHMQMIDGWSYMGFIVNQNEDDEPYRSDFPYFVEKERNHDQFIVSSIATDHIDSVFSANNLNFAPVWHLKRHKQVDPQND